MRAAPCAKDAALEPKPGLLNFQILFDTLTTKRKIFWPGRVEGGPWSCRLMQVLQSFTTRLLESEDFVPRGAAPEVDGLLPLLQPFTTRLLQDEDFLW